jgi:hypothetical protein
VLVLFAAANYNALYLHLWTKGFLVFTTKAHISLYGNQLQAKKANAQK